MSGRLKFSVLGPLTVTLDGIEVPTGGPKQRALLAMLLLDANRVVSRERLVREVFPEQSLNSADHALRNHISRLRKVLGPVTDAPRLVARAPGYLLRVEPGELDFERFEALAADGREALAAGDPLLAAESLRAAETLWRGRPLADLELEPFLRVESERLDDLRLAALETRFDAELALGRHVHLTPQLEALSAEHPFRERFRAQLMLALYRCGRQAEGLDVYRQTRALLTEELGLEPGSELQQLERAILVQDPVLELSHTSPSAPRVIEGVCPYKGLAPFEEEDAPFFFGRERLVDELVARLAAAPLLAVIGASGSGKSSLLHAGLLPALGDLERLTVRPAETTALDLAARLAATSTPLVLAVDQLEELFADGVAEEERCAFVDVIVDAAWNPDRRIRILLALRADFFGAVAPHTELADLVGANHVLLGPMSLAETRRAIEGPAARAGVGIEPELVDALVEEVGGETGALPLLSTTLLDLWLERDRDMLMLASYERTGRVRGAVARHAETAYASLDKDGRAIARRILLRLVAVGEATPPTRRLATLAELDVGEDSAAAGVLAALVEQRLLVADERSVELVHETLLEHWPRLRRWLEVDAEGRRLHRQLTETATRWEAGGHDPSELYRGSRLAATLDWLDGVGDDPGLNRVERSFVDESRAAHARETRRLRALLAGALMLLVVAVVAGALALQARGTAQRRATVATAQRLGAQALVEPRLDRSLLLARQGVALDDSSATEGYLLAALLRAPAALAVLHGTGARVLDDALSANGRLLAVRDDDGGVAFFDAATLRRVRGAFRGIGQITYFGAIVRPVRAVAFSPDGSTVAVGDSDGNHATLTLVGARTHRARAETTAPVDAVTADVQYAPDGRTLVTGEAVSGRFSPPSEVLVRRRASDGAPLRSSQPIPGGRLIGFALGGRELLVTSGERRSLLLDARTFAVRGTLPAAGAAALAPAGGQAAFGQDDGSVRLIDLRTRRIRPMPRRSSGAVNGVAFSRDGRVLATTSSDGTVSVWDVGTGALRETFRGHSSDAFAPVFSPDGRTLFTGSNDGSEIVWDVGGDRRLVQPFRFAPAARALAGPQPSLDTASTALAVSRNGRFFATSPNPSTVTIWRTVSQRVVAELRQPGIAPTALAWSPNSRLVAASGAHPDVVVWDSRTRSVVRRLGSSAHGALAVAFSPRGDLLATAGIDGSLDVYDLASGRRISSFVARGTLQDVDFSSDGRLLAAAGLGGEVVVWDVRRRRLLRVIPHHDAIFTLRFAPRGTELATGDVPGDVQFWNPVAGRQLAPTLGGQNGAVVSVSFSRNGSRLATTSTDGNIRLWDLPTRKLIGPPLAASPAQGQGMFTPDGSRVVAVFASGAGVIWIVDPTAWARQACRIADRVLTQDEWHELLPSEHYRPACR